MKQEDAEDVQGALLLAARKQKASKETAKDKRRRKKKKAPSRKRGLDRLLTEEASTSSSESQSGKKLLPPLKKLAQAEPGCVLQDLINHVRGQLSEVQLADGDGDALGSIESPARLVTYFNFFVRQR